MKHEKRQTLKATGLKALKTKWQCFLVTKEVQIPLGKAQGLSQ